MKSSHSVTEFNGPDTGGVCIVLITESGNHALGVLSFPYFFEASLGEDIFGC